MLIVTFEFFGSCVRKDRIKPMTPALLAQYKCNGGVSRKLESIIRSTAHSTLNLPSIAMPIIGGENLPGCTSRNNKLTPLTDRLGKIMYSTLDRIEHANKVDLQRTELWRQ